MNAHSKEDPVHVDVLDEEAKIDPDKSEAKNGLVVAAAPSLSAAAESSAQNDDSDEILALKSSPDKNQRSYSAHHCTEVEHQ